MIPGSILYTVYYFGNDGSQNRHVPWGQTLQGEWRFPQQDEPGLNPEHRGTSIGCGLGTAHSVGRERYHRRWRKSFLATLAYQDFTNDSAIVRDGDCSLQGDTFGPKSIPSILWEVFVLGN
jgi:hypothetical protein